jgi:hypothetical protein
MGVAPPAGDPTQGWSLQPLIYATGIITAASNGINCACSANQTITPVNGSFPFTLNSNAAMFIWANLNVNLSFTQLTLNSAASLPYGLNLLNTPNEVIFDSSIVTPQYADEASRLRTIAQQLNVRSYYYYRSTHLSTHTRAQWYILGMNHSMVYNWPSPRPEYTFFCDWSCPQIFPTNGSIDCVVNAAYTGTPGQGSPQLYAIIQDAINSNCKNILVVAQQTSYQVRRGAKNDREVLTHFVLGFFQEDLVMTEPLQSISSTTGACINGIHTVSMDHLTLRGLCFIQPGGVTTSQITVQSEMSYLYLLNDEFDGSGVRTNGFLTMQGEVWFFPLPVVELVVNYSLIQSTIECVCVCVSRSLTTLCIDWNYRALTVRNTYYFWGTNNLFVQPSTCRRFTFVTTTARADQ